MKELLEKNKVMEKSLVLSIRKNKKMAHEIEELKQDKLSTEDHVVEFNDFDPLIFDVPMDFIHAIATWIDEHPKEVAKRVEENKCQEEEEAKAVEEASKKNDEE